MTARLCKQRTAYRSKLTALKNDVPSGATTAASGLAAFEMSRVIFSLSRASIRSFAHTLQVGSVQLCNVVFGAREEKCPTRDKLRTCST